MRRLLRQKVLLPDTGLPRHQRRKVILTPFIASIERSQQSVLRKLFRQFLSNYSLYLFNIFPEAEEAAEKLETEGGGGFNPPHKSSKVIAGFSPGGIFSANSTQNIELFRSL
jgi:hypothetical protein